MIIFSTLSLLTQVAHKEVRFTLPLVCINSTIIGYVLSLHSRSIFSSLIVKGLVIFVIAQDIIQFQKFSS
jgi:hypothetical protein